MRSVEMFVACEGVALLAMFLQNEAWLRKVVCFAVNEEDAMSSERASRGAVCGRSLRADCSFAPMCPESPYTACGVARRIGCRIALCV